MYIFFFRPIPSKGKIDETKQKIEIEIKINYENQKPKKQKKLHEPLRSPKRQCPEVRPNGLELGCPYMLEKQFDPNYPFVLVFLYLCNN